MTNRIVRITLEVWGVVGASMFWGMAADVHATGAVFTPAVEIEVRDAVSSEPVKGAVVVTKWFRKQMLTMEGGGSVRYWTDIRRTDDNGRARIPRNFNIFLVSEFKAQSTLILDPYYEVLSIGMRRLKKGDVKHEMWNAAHAKEKDIRHPYVILEPLKRQSKISLEMTRPPSYVIIEPFKRQSKIRLKMTMTPLSMKYKDKTDGRNMNGVSAICGYWRVGAGAPGASLSDEVGRMTNDITLKFNYFVWAKKHKLSVNLEDVFRVWKETDKSNFVDVYFSEIREAVSKVR